MVIALPFLTVELAYEIRSRGRRLVPEVCGALAIEASAAAILVAGGEPDRLAIAAWMILAARTTAAVTHVRVQIARLHQRGSVGSVGTSDTAQAIGVLMAAVAVLIDRAVVGGLVMVIVIGLAHGVLARGRIAPAKRIGILQMVFGFAVVAGTAIGVRVH